MPSSAPPKHLFARVLDGVHAAVARLAAAGAAPVGLDLSRVLVEPPRDPSHGDMATNAAMVLAKDARQKPRDLAERIAATLRDEPLIGEVEVAGPGFINLRLRREAWLDELRAALASSADYGRSEIGKGEPVNVEYVSANPTGPMHVGHCRGAVFGDALASLLAFTGYRVTREYYINDAGAQVDVLARSAYLRYREALGEDIGPIPDGLYPGDYLKPVGRALANTYGPRLTSVCSTNGLAIVRDWAVDMMMTSIRKDLAALNVKHDKFFSERFLVEGRVRRRMQARSTKWADQLIQAVEELRAEHPGFGGSKIGPMLRSAGFSSSDRTVDRIIAYLTDCDLINKESRISRSGSRDQIAATIEELRGRDLVYLGRLPPPKGQLPDDWEDREQLLFRSTAYGDDVDRPLVKSDGSYTYFASDIAYHRSKFERGFRQLIDVWGADHGGYIKRMQAAVAAVTDGQADLDVKIVQLVRLLRAGEPVKMSKRAGDFVTLREVVDEVGRSAVRFMMLYRKNDAVLDFDLAKVIEQSRDNPVFYVQYGHARGMSVFRQAAAALPNLPSDPAGRLTFLREAQLERLEDEGELDIVKRLCQYPRVIESAALAHEPHRIAFYLYDLASAFHAHWTRGNAAPHLRFIILDDPILTAARLALVQGVVTVLASGLGLLGVEAPEEMR